MNDSVNANDSFTGTAKIHTGIWNKPQMKWLRHEVSQLKSSTRYPHKFESNNKRFPYEPEELIEPKTNFIKIEQNNAMHDTVLNAIWNNSIELKGIQPRNMYLQQNMLPLGLHRHKSHHDHSKSKCYIMPINTKESQDKTLVFKETMGNRSFSQLMTTIDQYAGSNATEESLSYQYNINHTLRYVDQNPHYALNNLELDKCYDHVAGTMLEISSDRLMTSTFFKSGNVKDYILTVFYLRDIHDNF